MFRSNVNVFQIFAKKFSYQLIRVLYDCIAAHHFHLRRMLQDGIPLISATLQAV